MLKARLATALEDGLIELPEDGRIAVIEPPFDADLSDLPKERVEVVARHFPTHDRFRREGFDTAVELTGRYAMAILSVPRARAEAEMWMCRARGATDGPIVVDGAKTDGVETLLRQIRKRTEVGEVLSKAHGKLFSVPDGDFSDWERGSTHAGRFRTVPGGFSADGIDPASMALATALPQKLGPHVVDLGAGWGFLSDAILAREGVERLDAVEADHAALEAAKTNVADPRVRFHWADARDWRPERPADHVVTNPPFHQGRRADPSLGQAFIRAASEILAPHGTLWLVANRHLPYETVLNEMFREVAELDGPPAFKLVRARKPKRPLRRG